MHGIRLWFQWRASHRYKPSLPGIVNPAHGANKAEGGFVGHAVLTFSRAGQDIGLDWPSTRNHLAARAFHIPARRRSRVAL
jgi:hypothetical protein